MPGPVTYFEWRKALEQFAAGDNALLHEMEQGSFELDAGTVYRFYEKVQDAYVARKKRWVDQFSRTQQASCVRSENDLAVILQSAKGNLRPIAAFIRLQAFPDDLRETLRKDFDTFIAETRKNIKATVQKEQPGNEKVLLMVQTFQFFDVAQYTNFTATMVPDAPRGRRILF